VVVVGDTGLDVTFLVESRAADEKRVVRGTRRGLGGTGANAAAIAARLGARVRLVTTVGTDALAAWIGAEVAKIVDAADVATLPGDSEVSLIVIDDQGRREVLVDIGVAESIDLAAARRAASWADWIYVTAPTPDLVRAILMGPDSPRLVVGAEARHLEADWGSLLGEADALITNSRGEANLPSSVPRIVCVTLGARGARVTNDGSSVVVPSPVVQEVDGTGAGDAFGGAFVSLLAAGSELHQAARLACAAGAAVASVLGAQSSLPDLNAIERLVHN
jgi:ribokinase